MKSPGNQLMGISSNWSKLNELFAIIGRIFDQECPGFPWCNK